MMKNKRFLMKNKCFLTENKRKTAENSGKQVRNASRKQPEQSNKQSFTHNFFKTSNTNTSIYNKKRKRERKKKYISSTEKEEEEEKEKAENIVNDRNVPVRQSLPSMSSSRKNAVCITVTPSPTMPFHVPTTTPSGTTACNAGNRSTGKKPPHLLPHPLGFAGMLPRICPENPRGIGHKARGNPAIYSQSGNL